MGRGSADRGRTGTVRAKSGAPIIISEAPASCRDSGTIRRRHSASTRAPAPCKRGAVQNQPVMRVAQQFGRDALQQSLLDLERGLARRDPGAVAEPEDVRDRPPWCFRRTPRSAPHWLSCGRHRAATPGPRAAVAPVRRSVRATGATARPHCAPCPATTRGYGYGAQRPPPQARTIASGGDASRNSPSVARLTPHRWSAPTAPRRSAACMDRGSRARCADPDWHAPRLQEAADLGTRHGAGRDFGHHDGCGVALARRQAAAPWLAPRQAVS